jgi:hypothetical protein
MEIWKQYLYKNTCRESDEKEAQRMEFQHPSKNFFGRREHPPAIKIESTGFRRNLSPPIPPE